MIFLRYFLWIAPNVLFIACVTCLVRRRLQRQYPIFLSYLVLQLLYFLTAIAADFLVSRSLASRETYLTVAVIGLGVSTALELGVMYELSSKILLSSPKLANISRPLLRWAAAALLLIAAALAALITRPASERWIETFQSLDFSANFIKIGLLIAALLLTRALAITWRSLPAGIALGFAISASAEVGASALISELGRRGYVTLDLVRMIGLNACVLVWLIYILLPQKTAASSQSASQISDLELQLRELQRMVRR